MSKKDSSIQFSLRSRTAYLIIAIFAFVLYANTLGHGFVLDDDAVIQNNRFVHEGIKGIPDLLTTFYWKGYWDSNAGLYRPVSMVMFAVEYQIRPNTPFLHHLINVVFYVLSCCLLFQVFTKLFSKINPLFFLFVTLLFVAHPIHTEVVANIKSRDEIMSLFFFLLCCRSLYFKEETGRSRVLAAVYFMLALLSKEGAIIFLPVILIVDHVKEKNMLNLIKARLNLIIASLVWFAWHRYVILTSGSNLLTYTRNDNSLVGAPFLDQKATAFGMFARYVIKSFFPYELSYDYSFNQIPIIGFASIAAISGLLIFGFLIWFAFKKFKSDPLITVSIALLLFPLCLTGNIFFNIGATMADRFLYIPTIGSCILICLIVYKLFKVAVDVKTIPSSIQFVLIAVMVLFSIRSFVRNKDWKDNFTLFQKDVNTVKNSARAAYNNALSLQSTQADLSMAQKEYERCLKMDPDYFDAMINLGSVYSKQKEYPAAINLYKKALALNPNSSVLLGNMGDSFYKSGKIDSAIVYLNKAHLAGNTNSESFNILGTAYFSKKEYEKAESAFEEGVKHDTANASLYLNYGSVLATVNKTGEALEVFKHAYRVDRKNPQACFLLAKIYLSLVDTLNSDRFLVEYKNLGGQ